MCHPHITAGQMVGVVQLTMQFLQIVPYKGYPQGGIWVNPWQPHVSVGSMWRHTRNRWYQDRVSKSSLIWLMVSSVQLESVVSTSSFLSMTTRTLITGTLVTRAFMSYETSFHSIYNQLILPVCRQYLTTNKDPSAWSWSVADSIRFKLCSKVSQFLIIYMDFWNHK